ncbi:pirin family protein [Lacisediminihabitans sp. H27-G8]|uniref:pirin family protein n=1 Tax=Lacisediminihabitans sp. H27-G8 TaxID=3111909 RepID=UPI0038FD2A99
MSNLEKHPAELLEDPAPPSSRAVEIFEPRDVPLGGPRAMSVRRTLPQRRKSLIGAWCFVDHYGPDVVAETTGMVVPPHPHTGLQTVSWLFAGVQGNGEIEHRDSIGSHALVRPGELNLMTAGHGIAHSEVSTAATALLHGAQLWIALPDDSRDHAPFFEHFAPSPVDFDGATVRVFIGSLVGQHSPATVFSGLVGAQLDLPAGASLALPVDPRFEHAVLVDAGDLRLDGEPVPVSHLGAVGVGRDILHLEAGDAPARLLLIGGEPLGESIVMWWNFIGRSHEEIVAFRADWQADVVAGADDAGRFGSVRGYAGSPLPAPELPNVRLRARE